SPLKGVLVTLFKCVLFFFSSRRRHTRSKRDWSSDVCSSDLRVAGMIRLVIADDHPVVRAGLRAMFQAEDDIDVVAEVSTGPDARSEERRVGKEGRCGWAACDRKKKNQMHVETSRTM